MTEYIGNTFVASLTETLVVPRQGLQSHNRLFTLTVEGRNLLLKQDGKLVKSWSIGQIMPTNLHFQDGGWFHYAGKGEYPRPVWKDAPVRNNARPGWALVLQDDGDIAYVDNGNIVWTRGTAQANLPLTKYAMKNIEYSPIATAPAEMAMNSGSRENRTTVAQTLSIDLEWDQETSLDIKFDHSAAWEIGGKVSLEFGIPIINAGKGTIEVSGKYGQKDITSNATTIKKSTKFVIRVDVETPPMSKVTASAVVKKLSVSGVTFRGTMEITYGDGSIENVPTSGTMNCSGLYSDYTIRDEQFDLDGKPVAVPSSRIIGATETK